MIEQIDESSSCERSRRLQMSECSIQALSSNLRVTKEFMHFTARLLQSLCDLLIGQMLIATEVSDLLLKLREALLLRTVHV